MIRVVVERWLGEESDAAIAVTMRDLRREAIHAAGYVTGETLRDVEAPHHFVTISTWRTRQDWEAWASSEKRQEIEGEIGLMLAEPEKVIICEPV